jgi:hypothetical protein
MSKVTNAKGAMSVSEVVEHLPRKHNPQITKKKKRKKKIYMLY